MSELSVITHDLLSDIANGEDGYPPSFIKLMTLAELSVVLELEESDLDGWDFGVDNADLLASAKIYCKIEKRRLVKEYVFSLKDFDEYDIELYALEFGYPFSKAKALLERGSKK